jgi:hypothetical protein
MVDCAECPVLTLVPDQQAINLTNGLTSDRGCRAVDLLPAAGDLSGRGETAAALLHRNPTPHPAHGLLCQRAVNRPHHLLHLPWIQLEWKTRAPAFFHKWPRIAHQNSH